MRIAIIGVVAGIALLGVATLVGFLDGVNWFFELPGFFRLQYAVALAALTVAAIALRLYPVALCGLALVAVNAAIVAPTWAAPADAELLGTARLRALVVNVEVGNDRYAAVEELIRETDPDVVGVTELGPAWVSHLAPVLSDYEQIAVPQSDAYGIGLYSRVPLLDARIEHFPADDGPPTVVATLEIGGKPVTLVLTHVHTPFAGDIHSEHLESLAAARPRLGERVAVCGDFNAVPWSSPMRSFAEEADLVGTHQGNALDSSWPTWNSLLGVPLDNCFLSDGLAAVERHHGPDVGSDHLPLFIELGITRLDEDAATTAP